MTTVVVTRKAGMACIAADTLASYGSLKEGVELVTSHEKLVAIGGAWVAPTGPASAQLILKHFAATYEEAPRLETPEQIFDFLLQLQRALKEDYFVQSKEDASDDYESMRMELLVASRGGIFGAYPQRSVQEFSRFYAFGSGAEYAMGAMHVAWDRVHSAEELARIGVETAAHFDMHSGPPITLRTIPIRGQGD